MPLEIEFNHPEFPKGMEFDIGGIGVVNGETVTVTEEQELLYVSRNRESVRDGVEGSPFLKVKGSGSVTPKEAAKMFPDDVSNTNIEDDVQPEEDDDDEGGDK